jgi:hypothetical protein
MQETEIPRKLSTVLQLSNHMIDLPPQHCTKLGTWMLGMCIPFCHKASVRMGQEARNGESD